MTAPNTQGPASPATDHDAQLNAAVAWMGQLLRGPNGRPLPVLTNARLLVANHPDLKGRLRWNEFTAGIEVNAQWGLESIRNQWRPIRDSDITSLRIACDSAVGLSSEMAWGAAYEVALVNPRHPVREYLDALKWDGTPRLDTLFPRYFGSEDRTVTREAGAKFCIGAVARIYQPGCKVDTYPVLEGKMGTFKSTGIATLVGNRDWFSDTDLDLDTKDRFQALSGVWIQEVAELQSFSRADTNRLKSFVSSSTDKYRPPYGKTFVQQPRQTVFCATTNESDYVADWTGERRKWPVRVGVVDIPALTADRDQLWAEAKCRYDAGEVWHLTGESAQEMYAEAMERHIEDPWIERLEAELRRTPMPEYVSSAEVQEALELDAKASQADLKRMARCLRFLGFERKKRRVGGEVRNTWSTPVEWGKP